METEEVNGYRLLREDDLSIIFSDNVVFDSKLKMEKLGDSHYNEEDNSIFDKLWTDTSSTDQSDDEFFSADEDPAILGSHLMNQLWWKGTHTLEYATLAVTKGTPVSYKDAMASDEAHYWKEAMDSEMKSIRDNVTYKLDVPPAGKKPIGSRWVFSKET